MNKTYFNWVVDFFEADMYKTTSDSFNKHSSVSERGGRPYLYSPREIGVTMVAHFRNCIEYDQSFTISGLCIRLGVSREGMRQMEKSSNEEIVVMIKKGKNIVESYWEYMGQVMPNPSFAIFVLKNMGWCEKWSIKKRPIVGLSYNEIAEAQERVRNFSE